MKKYFAIFVLLVTGIAQAQDLTVASDVYCRSGPGSSGFFNIYRLTGQDPVFQQKDANRALTIVKKNKLSLVFQAGGKEYRLSIDGQILGQEADAFSFFSIHQGRLSYDNVTEKIECTVRIPRDH